MSTGLIIAIVIVAIIVIALLVLMPRLRENARVKARERELQQRRERVADEHRTEAGTREREAERAEREARIAQKQAERQRAEAELHQERAAMHESGEADDELIDEGERERFAGTSALGGRDADTDDTTDDTATTGTRSEFEQGREVGQEESRGRRFDRGADDTGAEPAEQPAADRRNYS